jgi:hypothetical protein
MQTQSLKYYEDSSFVLNIEIEKDFVILHCDVMVWKLSTLKKIYAVFSQILLDFKTYKVIAVTPNPRFAKLFGGRTVTYMEYEGKTMEIIQWQ